MYRLPNPVLSLTAVADAWEDAQPEKPGRSDQDSVKAR